MRRSSFILSMISLGRVEGNIVREGETPIRLVAARARVVSNKVHGSPRGNKHWTEAISIYACSPPGPSHHLYHQIASGLIPPAHPWRKRIHRSYAWTHASLVSFCAARRRCNIGYNVNGEALCFHFDNWDTISVRYRFIHGTERILTCSEMRVSRPWLSHPKKKGDIIVNFNAYIGIYSFILLRCLLIKIQIIWVFADASCSLDNAYLSWKSLVRVCTTSGVNLIPTWTPIFMPTQA